MPPTQAPPIHALPILCRFNQDHSTAALIWNYKTREELREALENEIRAFTVDRVRRQGKLSSVMQHTSLVGSPVKAALYPASPAVCWIWERVPQMAPPPTLPTPPSYPCRT